MTDDEVAARRERNAVSGWIKHSGVINDCVLSTKVYSLIDEGEHHKWQARIEALNQEQEDE